MPDQFDIQRKLDHAAEEELDELTEKLVEDKDKARERLGRLIRLDEHHYFDPQDKWVLLKDGSQFKKLSHSPAHLRKALDRIEAQALGQGYMPVKGGLFWNAKTRGLYVKNGGHYVLYTLERRKAAR